jgi:outer membrane lipoprotein SlyB
MRHALSILTVGSCLLGLTACGTPGPTTTGEIEIRSGVIEQITATEVKSNHELGVGAILGGSRVPGLAA